MNTTETPPPEIIVENPVEEPVGTVEPTQSSWERKLNRISAVATSPQYQKFFIVMGLIVIAGMLYYTLFVRTPTKKEVEQQNADELQKKLDQVVQTAIPVTPKFTQKAAPKTAVQQPAVPTLAPPKLVTPAPPTPPMAPPPPVPAAIFKPPAPPSPPPSLSLSEPTVLANQPATSNNFEIGFFNKPSKEEIEARRKAILAKRSASSIVYGGGAGSGGKNSSLSAASNKKQDASDGGDNKNEFLGFSNGTLDKTGLAHTSAKQVTATTVGDLNNLILQGKMMSAVLETAINTALPGKLRAIISSDVYAESGKKILIPKGSRLIGDYDNNIAAGQTRIKITWQRLIRPDGVDVSIDAIGADGLGRAGVIAKIDNKILEQVGGAFLVSYVIPALFNKLSNAQPLSVSTSTSGTNTTTTTTGNANTVTTANAINQFSAIATNSINSLYPTTPVADVPQGTTITVLVNSDLLFPSDGIIGQDKVLK